MDTRGIVDVPLLITKMAGSNPSFLVELTREEILYIYTLIQPLRWESSYSGNQSEKEYGYEVGHNVFHQLSERVMINDLVTAINCVCENIQLGGGGAGSITEGLPLANSPFSEVWPTEASNPSEPLYGGTIGGGTWGEARDHKCKLAKWWVIRYQGLLGWFEFNTYTNIDAMAVLAGAMEALIGKAAIQSVFLLDTATAILEGSVGWIGDEIANITSDYDCYVTDIYTAASPLHAANLLKLRNPENPIPAIALAYMLDPVFRGEKTVGPAIDVTGYTGDCSVASSLAWVFCAGGGTPEYNVDVDVTTSMLEGVQQTNITFPHPVDLMSVGNYHANQNTFNLNTNATDKGCPAATWDTFVSGGYFYGNPVSGLPYVSAIRQLRIFGPTTWTPRIHVRPVC